MQFERDAAREADDAHLGGGVIRLAEVADQARGRGEVHEGARLLILEVIGRGAAHIERAVEVDLDHLIEVDDGHAVEDAVAQNAGVVDHAVDAFEAVERALDDLFRALRLGDAVVAGNRFAAGLADLLHDLFGRLLAGRTFAVDSGAEVIDDDLRAFLGREHGHTPANATARAGYDNDLTFQAASHLRCLSSSILLELFEILVRASWHGEGRGVKSYGRHGSARWRGSRDGGFRPFSTRSGLRQGSRRRAVDHIRRCGTSRGAFAQGADY